MTKTDIKVLNALTDAHDPKVEGGCSDKQAAEWVTNVVNDYTTYVGANGYSTGIIFAGIILVVGGIVNKCLNKKEIKKLLK